MSDETCPRCGGDLCVAVIGEQFNAGALAEQGFCFRGPTGLYDCANGSRSGLLPPGTFRLTKTDSDITVNERPPRRG